MEHMCLGWGYVLNYSLQDPFLKQKPTFFKNFKLVALIFIEAFDIYYYLAFIPHTVGLSLTAKYSDMIQTIKDSQVY